MPNRWQQSQLEATPKVEPWMSFGVTLVIAVMAVLFAAGTWIIRSGQATKAMERSAKTAEELTSTKEQLGKTQLEVTSAHDESEHRRQRIEALEQSESQLKDEIAKLLAEQQATQRELEGTKAALVDTRKQDADPGVLTPAKLKDVIGGEPIKLLAFVSDPDPTNPLEQGGLIEYTKMKSLSVCGLQFADSSPTLMILSLVAVSSSDDRTALGVSIQIQQRWKTPGAANVQWVSIWHQHTAGLTTRDSAQSFAEQMIETVLKELKLALEK